MVSDTHAAWPGKAFDEQAAAARAKAAAEAPVPEASSPARQGSSSVCSEVCFVLLL